MKKKYWLFIICIIIVTCTISIGIILNKFNQVENEKEIDVNSNKNTESLIINSTNEQKIEDIKQDLGYNNTDTTIYEIKKEYDGREVISIKPNIQYKVAMAGVIKNEKPEFSEIDNLLERAPNKTGIWIENSSREQFLDILKKIANCEYTINEEGYLMQEQKDNSNEIDKLINTAMNNKKNYSICINSIAYLVDEVTGNIEEYPFEEIDPEQSFELFETENASLYVITKNTYKKLDYKNIIEEVFNNMTI